MRIASIAAALSLLAVTPAFATEGPPTGVGDHNGRAELSIDPRSTVPDDGLSSPRDGAGQPIVIDLHRLLATEEGPGSAGDHNGHAELTTDTHQMFAGDGPPTGPGDGTSRAELTIDTHQMFATDAPGGPGDNTGHAELTTDPLLIVAGCRGGLGGEV